MLFLLNFDFLEFLFFFGTGWTNLFPFPRNISHFIFFFYLAISGLILPPLLQFLLFNFGYFCNLSLVDYVYLIDWWLIINLQIRQFDISLSAWGGGEAGVGAVLPVALRSRSGLDLGAALAAHRGRTKAAGGDPDGHTPCTSHWRSRAACGSRRLHPSGGRTCG